MERHAYLILAHSNWEQLQILISLLDDPRNDIFIHIDAKSDISSLHLKTLHSEIVYTKRIDVRWGNVSLIEAELSLFEQASTTRHSYYHLLSGIDLPLHSQNYIHNFLRGKNYEYIGFGRNDWNVHERVFCHNLFMRNMRYKNRYVRGVLQKMRQGFDSLQKVIHYKRHIPNQIYRYGCNWVSVTHDFVCALIENKAEFLRIYKYSYCPDEIYKQTYAINSDFKSRIYDLNDEFNGCLREIDWKRGRPYLWRKEDYAFLSNSKRLFARKFDVNIDRDIVYALIEKIKNE